VGAPDLSKYVVKIDSSLLDINGTLVLTSVRIKPRDIPIFETAN